MGHQHDRNVERRQRRAHLVADARPGRLVERRERFVEQDGARLPGQRARERHALALAARQCARPRVRQRRDPEPVEPLGRDPAPRIAAHAARGQAVRHVVEHVEMRKQRVLLKEVRHVAAERRDVDAAVVQNATAERNAPGVRPYEAGDDAQQRRFPGAARPDQQRDAGVETQLDVEDELAQRLADGQLDHALRRSSIRASTTIASAIVTSTTASAADKSTSPFSSPR